jgi:glycosyltransferase involved in cell wall biosynthesis
MVDQIQGASAAQAMGSVPAGDSGDAAAARGGSTSPSAPDAGPGAGAGRLRITHVLGSLHVGGGERVALLLAQCQVADGHEVAVVSLEQPPHGPLFEEFAGGGVPVRTVPKRPGFDPTLPPRLFGVLRDLRPDIVHTHNPPPQIYAIAPARLAGARVVHTKHGPHPDAPHRLWMRRAGAALAFRFVAVSPMTAEFAREIHECPEDRLRIVQNGTDLDRFRPDPTARIAVRGELGVPDDAVLLGTVGRLATVKNHALLLRATAPLLGPKLHLAIAGGGPEAGRTRALVEELGVSAFVHLVGEIAEVPRLLAGLDVFVLSSDVEGLPLSVTEAMGVALPVVSTAVGGVPKVVLEGETGLLAPPRDEEALRKAIQSIASSPETRERMGKRAREVALARYSSERMAREYMALYRGEA